MGLWVANLNFQEILRHTIDLLSGLMPRLLSVHCATIEASQWLARIDCSEGSCSGLIGLLARGMSVES